MHKKWFPRLYTSFVAFVLLFICIYGNGATGAELPTPVVSNPVEGRIFYTSRPQITGTTKTGTLVDVYIDGELLGKATVTVVNAEKSKFVFTPATDLEPGTHTLSTIARTDDTYEMISFPSDMVMFDVRYKAPTLFAPLVNENTNKSRPYIIGVAPSDAFIDIYVNGVKDGSIKTKKHPSGFSNFSYLPVTAFTQGTKEIVAKWVRGTTVLAESIPVLYYTDASFTAPTIWYKNGLLRGITQSAATVQVYVNNTLNGEFLTTDDPTGMTTFAYKINKPTPKMMIRARATSSAFEVSPFSPEVVVNPVAPKIPAKTTVTVTPETKPEEKKPEEKKPVVNKNVTPLPNLNDYDRAQRNQSIWILTVLTIIVLTFIGWFVWANREFFLQKNDQDKK